MNIELLNRLSIDDIESIRRLTDDEIRSYYNKSRLDEFELEYNYNKGIVTYYNWRKIIKNIISGIISENKLSSNSLNILNSYLDHNDDKYIEWFKKLVGERFNNKKITLKYYLSDVYVDHNLSSNNLKGYNKCKEYHSGNMKNQLFSELIQRVVDYLIFAYNLDSKDWYKNHIDSKEYPDNNINRQYHDIKDGRFTNYINKINQIIEDLNINLSIFIDYHISYHTAGDNTKFILNEIKKIKCKFI